MHQHQTKLKVATWKKRMDRQKASGLSARQWCKNHNVAYSTFHLWKSRLEFKRQSQPRFKELVDPPVEEIILEFFGARLLLRKNFDTETLSRFIGVLKSC